MASVNGTNYAKTADPTSSNILDRAVIGGKVKVMHDSYEAASLASGTTIKIGKDLQSGDRILDVWIVADALGDNVTLSAGDSDTATRYISATVANTANLRIDLDQIDGFNYEIGTNSGDNTILITTGSSTGTQAATGTIKVCVLYAES